MSARPERSPGPVTRTTPAPPPRPALATVPARASTSAPAPAGAPPTARRRMWSIRWIVTAAMVGLVAATVLSVGAFSEHSARRAIQFELQAQLSLQARNLAMVGSNALLSDVPEWTLLPLIKEIVRRQPDYAFVVVVDARDTIVADVETRRLGTPFHVPSDLAPLAGSPPPIAGEALLASPRLLVASAPILNTDGRRLGMVWLGLERAAVVRKLEAARRQQLLVLGLFLLLGTAAAWSLSTVLLRPIAALRAGLERIGRGDLDTRVEVRDRTELGALAVTINRMAGELKTAQVELVERERIAHEVQLARRIQVSLLPAGHRIAGPFVIEGEQRAASEVGGDYYQTLELPGGRVGLVVADVAGKGLAGSLVTAMLHALLRPLAASHASPAALLGALDQQLGAMLERGSFVTMFYGILDPASGDLTFASAGHNPLLVVRRTRLIEWFRVKGAPLGAVRSLRQPARYEEARVVLAPGDAAIQYTDGISEAPRPDDAEEFGLERLAEAALAAASPGARAVLDAVDGAVTRWRKDGARHDDETVLVVGHDANASNGGAPAAGAESHAAALGRLAEAQAHGHRLTLPASLGALVRLDDWLAGRPELAAVTGPAAELMRLALYEICANIVQHACGEDATQTFDLWWVPSDPATLPTAAPSPYPPGYFLLRDRGQSFRYQSWQPPSLEDPAVRRRGHGFGIQILRKITERITYVTGTPEGNLTFLALAPGGSGREEDHGHQQ
jgi:serine phosphatase RsbU (regulator of sigma subunit)